MSSFLPLLYCNCKSKFESYTTHVQNGLDPEGLLKGGGGTESQRLEPTAQAAMGEEYEGRFDPPLIKIFVSENAFQAIWKPIFPYSITSILS